MSYSEYGNEQNIYHKKARFCLAAEVRPQRAGNLVHFSGTIVFPDSIVHFYSYTNTYIAHGEEELRQEIQVMVFN